MQKIISLLLFFISTNLMAADLSSCQTKDVKMLIKNFKKVNSVSMRVDIKEVLEYIYVDCTDTGLISSATKEAIEELKERTENWELYALFFITWKNLQNVLYWEV